MTEEQTHAWIFLSVSEEPSKLDEIIGMADAINHAIPTQSELQHSLGWLKSNGFISKSGKSYQYTEQGKELRNKASKRKGSIFKTWEFIEKEFIKLLYSPSCEERITEDEVEKSYKKYNKWFWETYNKLKSK